MVNDFTQESEWHQKLHGTIEVTIELTKSSVGNSTWRQCSYVQYNIVISKYIFILEPTHVIHGIT